MQRTPERDACVTIVGGGYVGLALAAYLVMNGRSVVLVEADPERRHAFARGEMPIYEAGVESVLAQAVRESALLVTGDLRRARRDPNDLRRGGHAVASRRSYRSERRRFGHERPRQPRSRLPEREPVSKKVLLTGAAGFIGSHVAEALLARGDEVVGLDNFEAFYSPNVKRRNVRAALADNRYTLVEGDLKSAAAVGRVFGEHSFDAVIHLAARAGVRPSLLDPVGYSETNVSGTALLLEAARGHGVGHFVFASSSSVYGARSVAPFRESDPVDDPVSPYAATKRAGEILAGTFHHLYGLPVTCLRFFTVYGPRQRPDMAIHRFTRLIYQGGEVEVYGDGRSERDYTFVDDVVDGVLRALDRPRGYRIYNLGTNRTIPLMTLIELISAGLNRAPRIVRLPNQPGDVPMTCADITQAQSELGYDPATKLDDGIATFIDWYRKESACLTSAH
jgi:UDP-glucuronate 4-epimerase